MMNVLIIEDDYNQLKILSNFFSDNGFNVFSAPDGKEGIKIFKNKKIEIVISDYRMPGLTGKDVLKEILNIDPHVTFIIITAYSSVKEAVELIKIGAFDYIQKPINLEYLLKKVNNAKKYIRSEKNKKNFINKLKENELEQGYIFHSRAMTEILHTSSRIAHTDAAVLLTGESGTGKEVIAEIIHKLGPRKENEFVAINCAAIPENLIESELFGHVKGAFTGAVNDKVGRFELADKGTLFLDEIGDISFHMQVKLLRALENMEFQPVGSSKSQKVDVRVISATNKVLTDEIKAGNFRKDLFYRINVIPIHIPPLRERKKDIPKLVKYFLEKQKSNLDYKIDNRAMESLINYDWPGNIRELRNILHRVTALNLGQKITLSDLPDEVKNKDLNDIETAEKNSLDIVEKNHIKKIMTECDGNQVKAAKILGIHRNTLRRKLRKYNLD